MPTTGDVFMLREGESVTIRSLTPEALEMEAVWGHGHGPPPRHSHPTQDERFDVLEGELTVQTGRNRPLVLRASDGVDIPRGTVHRMWNSGEGQARATWKVMPSQRTAEMFEAMDSGMNPARAAKILWEFRREFRLSSSLRG
jgi:Uncharacterized conserved protein, contains double-stranded beta-helix domain